MDVIVALAPEPLVWLYFSTLGYAATRTFGGAARGWPRPVALVSIAVTWFLIVRWMVEYKREGGNEILVQAYVDVLRTSHYAVSAQLLTWVAVAIVWAHEAPLHVILFGMLGAMSAAFACWIPANASDPRGPAPSGRWIPVGHVAGALAALYSTAKLAPLADPAWAHNAPERAEFSWWLHLLHLILAVPAVLGALWPGQPRVDGRWAYLLLAGAVACVHWREPQGAPGALARWTDCQLSIGTDLALCALLTLYYVWSTTRSVGALLAVAAAMPVASPGAVLAAALAARSARGLRREAATALQARLARAAGAPKGWMNLGLREGASAAGEEGACAALAERLARGAGLEAGDGVLAVGSVPPPPSISHFP